MNIKKINILSIHPSGLAFGGDETRLLNQCRLLDKEVFNCIICAPKRASEEDMMGHFEAARARIIFIKTLPLNSKLPSSVGYFLRALNFLLYFLQLIKIILNEKIDVLDGRLRGGGVLALFAKMVTRHPVLVTIYGIDESKTLYKRIARYLLQFSNVIICDSVIKLDEIRNWVSSKNPHYLIIPSAIELKYSADEALEKSIAEKKSSGKIIIGQVSNLVPRKGQDVLISAFAANTTKYDNIELWIVGSLRDAEYYRSLVNLVKSLSLESKVRFIHYPGFIGNIFKALDIQVHPTRKDSLPNCILEGMSIGVPLISSSIGGIPEMVSHRKTGLLFDIENPEQLNSCIDELLKDVNFRKELGQAAKKRFDEDFSALSLSVKLEDTLKSVLNSRQLAV